jgi:hypothetical protein
MVGVLASQKTLSGGDRNARSPAPEEIAGLFPNSLCVLGLVHYFTKNPETLCEQLIRVHAVGGEYCDGVQINVPWPPVDQLEAFGQWVPRGTRIVLQVGPKALADIGPDGNILAKALAASEQLGRYRGLITDVLIDPSGGRGLPMNLALTRALVYDIRHCMPDLGITIAGGLCAETLPVVASMVRSYGLSMDAEGRLRDEHDQLDMGKALAWMREAAPLVCEH